MHAGVNRVPTRILDECEDKYFSSKVTYVPEQFIMVQISAEKANVFLLHFPLFLHQTLCCDHSLLSGHNMLFGGEQKGLAIGICALSGSLVLISHL